jgi:hypothetical protein
VKGLNGGSHAVLDHHVLAITVDVGKCLSWRSASLLDCHTLAGSDGSVLPESVLDKQGWVWAKLAWIS